jgi:electron transport complex protein RnfG
MNENARMVVVLTAFALGAGLLLAWTDRITRKPIEYERKQETLGALKRVLPACDNDVEADARKVSDAGQDRLFYVARRQGAFVGAAFKVQADGYGGPVETLVGLLPDGTVNAIEILQADKETPGLGNKVRDAGFLGQIKGRSATDTRWAAVRKDGGEIQAITGATISSRAVAQSVKAGMDAYARHAAAIRGQDD